MPHRTAEVCAHWCRKSLFRPVKIFFWDIRLKGPLEDMLSFAACKLQPALQPCRPFDELMIEERVTNFERHSHAGAIDFGENISREIGLDIGVEGASERVAGIRLSHHSGDALRRIMSFKSS